MSKPNILLLYCSCYRASTTEETTDEYTKTTKTAQQIKNTTSLPAIFKETCIPTKTRIYLIHVLPLYLVFCKQLSFKSWTSIDVYNVVFVLSSDNTFSFISEKHWLQHTSKETAHLRKPKCQVREMAQLQTDFRVTLTKGNRQCRYSV